MDNPTNNKPPSFNWAMLIGFCVMTLGIIWAGGRIADRLPHGFFSPPLQPTPVIHQDSDFLSEWQVADLLAINVMELWEIIESGELDGTFTTLQIQRAEWGSRHEYWNSVVSVTRYPTGYTMVDHRIFSRERLLGWFNNRIDDNR